LEGYLREAKVTKTSGRTIYEITERGSERMGEVSRIVTEAAGRFQDMRRIFYDLVEPAALTATCLKAIMANSQILRELVESRPPKIDSRAIKALLEELRGTLRQEQAWVERDLSKARRR